MLEFILHHDTDTAKELIESAFANVFDSRDECISDETKGVANALAALSADIRRYMLVNSGKATIITSVHTVDALVERNPRELTYPENVSIYQTLLDDIGKLSVSGERTVWDYLSRVIDVQVSESFGLFLWFRIH